MINYKPGTLAIKVRAEVEEKCEEQFCSACHPDKSRDMGIILAGGKPYVACNGSATRKVTLEGWCPVKLACDTGRIPPRALLRLPWMQAAFETEEQICTVAIQSLQDGTCPDEIRAQLKVVG